MQQLVQLVSELSKVSGFVSKHCYYGSSLREYEHEHRQYRRFSETSFFNCNSENTVVACQSIMDESVAEEASYDDGYFGTISHRAVEGGDPVGELLTKFAPTEEWCCG